MSENEKTTLGMIGDAAWGAAKGVAFSTAINTAINFFAPGSGQVVTTTEHSFDANTVSNSLEMANSALTNTQSGYMQDAETLQAVKANLDVASSYPGLTESAKVQIGNARDVVDSVIANGGSLTDEQYLSFKQAIAQSSGLTTGNPGAQTQLQTSIAADNQDYAYVKTGNLSSANADAAELMSDRIATTAQGSIAADKLVVSLQGDNMPLTSAEQALLEKAKFLTDNLTGNAVQDMASIAEVRADIAKLNQDLHHNKNTFGYSQATLSEADSLLNGVKSLEEGYALAQKTGQVDNFISSAKAVNAEATNTFSSKVDEWGTRVPENKEWAIAGKADAEMQTLKDALTEHSEQAMPTGINEEGKALAQKLDSTISKAANLNDGAKGLQASIKDVQPKMTVTESAPKSFVGRFADSFTQNGKIAAAVGATGGAALGALNSLADSNKSWVAEENKRRVAANNPDRPRPFP